MALSFSQSLSHPVSHRPLLHGSLPFASQLQLIPASKPSTGLLKFPSFRCSSSFNDKTRITLNTGKNSKTQYDPVLNNPIACRFHAAQFGGQESEKSYVEAYAVGRHIRMSADKARRVIDQIRGRSYEDTLMILELMPYRACDPILKLVLSAGANASHNMGLSKGSLIISKAEVNGGSITKRLRPQARGRGYPIRRRTCHITVVVRGLASETETEAKPV